MGGKSSSAVSSLQVLFGFDMFREAIWALSLNTIKNVVCGVFFYQVCLRIASSSSSSSSGGSSSTPTPPSHVRVLAALAEGTDGHFMEQRFGSFNESNASVS
jgi:hypothetical protein